MPSELGLSIRRQSATPTSSTAIRDEGVEVSKLVDIDLCIGCKACEVACKEWNDLEAEETSGFVGYQSHPDLTADTWDLMRFNEVELDDGGLAWLIKKDSCLHCEEPGCLEACPAPGAVVQYENGIVDFDQEKCIGCRYCIAGCPFDIPRFDEETKKVYKCTLCVDRVSNGLEPACVKACPTGSIRFGSKEDMVAYGEEKVAKLAARGFDNAMLYDPEGVGGLHMMYVVPRGDMLAGYDLPEDPEVPGTYFTSLRALRTLGTASMWAGLDPTVVAASALLRAPAEQRAAAATYPLVDAADIADPVDGEVVVAIDALVPVSRLPPPLMTAAGALGDRGLRAAAVAQWLVDPALPDPAVGFWINVAAQPVFELAAIGAPVPRREHWAAAACPVCGAAAQVSIIAEESGEFMAGSPRSLWCSRCAADWTYPRARCVSCGEDDSRRVGSWVADVWPTARIESCDTCRGYIKTFDLREPGGVDVVPLVDDVASATLDLWATGRGLQRSVRSLVGV